MKHTPMLGKWNREHINMINSISLLATLAHTDFQEQVQKLSCGIFNALKLIKIWASVVLLGQRSAFAYEEVCSLLYAVMA